jgi:hypothetical protein
MISNLKLEISEAEKTKQIPPSQQDGGQAVG